MSTCQHPVENVDSQSTATGIEILPMIMEVSLEVDCFPVEHSDKTPALANTLISA